MEYNPLQSLREEYYFELEQDGVDFLEYDDAGNSFVKLEYATASVEEMLDYLGIDGLAREWALMNCDENYRQNRDREFLNQIYK